MKNKIPKLTNVVGFGISVLLLVQSILNYSYVKLILYYNYFRVRTYHG